MNRQVIDSRGGCADNQTKILAVAPWAGGEGRFQPATPDLRLTGEPSEDIREGLHR